MGVKGKLRTVPNGHAAYCPGCQEFHVINNSWQFNGQYDLPTFNPSILVRGYSEKFKRDFVCHSFVTDGAWNFLSDSTHDRAGEIVSLRSEEAEDGSLTIDLTYQLKDESSL